MGSLWRRWHSPAEGGSICYPTEALIIRALVGNRHVALQRHLRLQRFDQFPSKGWLHLPSLRVTRCLHLIGPSVPGTQKQQPH